MRFRLCRCALLPSAATNQLCAPQLARFWISFRFYQTDLLLPIAREALSTPIVLQGLPALDLRFLGVRHTMQRSVDFFHVHRAWFDFERLEFPGVFRRRVSAQLIKQLSRTRPFCGRHALAFWKKIAEAVG